jgi:ABC-type transporter Mla maintaining outer membrane lipid asymmetry ATPase subunit MlaF
MLHRGLVVLDGSLGSLLESRDPLVQQFVEGDLEGLASEASSLSGYHRDLLM